MSESFHTIGVVAYTQEGEALGARILSAKDYAHFLDSLWPEGGKVELYDREGKARALKRSEISSLRFEFPPHPPSASYLELGASSFSPVWMHVSGPGPQWRSTWLTAEKEYRDILSAIANPLASFFFMASDAGLSRVMIHEMDRIEFRFGAVRE